MMGNREAGLQMLVRRGMRLGEIAGAMKRLRGVFTGASFSDLTLIDHLLDQRYPAARIFDPISIVAGSLQMRTSFIVFVGTP